jgi:quercetin dioxygenase-like cupin family protein
MDTIVRGRDEGLATWFVNGLAIKKASVDETAGAYTLAEHLITAASNPPLHRHEREEEAWYVLDGEIEFEIDGACAVARPGTYALAPRGSVHTWRVLTDTARALVITSTDIDAGRGDFERFVEAAGTPATAPVLPVPAAPDPVVLSTVGSACGIELLPPEA